MAVLKCKMCGGTVELTEIPGIGICDHCNSKQTITRANKEKILNLYDRAGYLRRSNEFDKAMSLYEQILNEDITDSEAYWSLVLCRYGIEYVEDPADRKRKPTVHRVQYESILADEDYKQALKNADEEQRKVYENEAKTISEIQRKILAISEKEKPFDIFICYKETDDNGKRTADSVMANDIYHNLTQEGYKVFYSAITLEKTLGKEYEPYIFAALNSAKVMLVIGTKREYFNAVWVKNEWSRFLQLAKSDRRRQLIPCYSDMDPYDLPEEFAHLLVQDMSKIGFINELVRGIKKVIQPKTENPIYERNSETLNINLAAPILRRTFLCLEDGDFNKADELAEQVLNLEPENAEAYLAKLMIEQKVCKRTELFKRKIDVKEDLYFGKALRFSNGELNEKLVEFYNKSLYLKATDLIKEESENSYKDTIAIFEELGSYKDSDEQKEIAIDKYNALLYKKALILRNEAFESNSAEKAQETAAIFENILTYKDSKSLYDECIELHNSVLYNEALELKNKAVNSNNIDMIDTLFKEAYSAFSALGNYSDSVQQRDECLSLRNEMIYALGTEKEKYESISAQQEVLKIYDRICDYKDSREKIQKAKKRITLLDELSKVQEDLKATKEKQAEVRSNKRMSVVFLIISWLCALSFISSITMLVLTDKGIRVSSVQGIITCVLSLLWAFLHIAITKLGDESSHGKSLVYVFLNPIYILKSLFWWPFASLGVYFGEKNTIKRDLQDACNQIESLQNRADEIQHELSNI